MIRERKPKCTHPFLSLEHRVIDSPAFADIKPSSLRVLVAIGRQLNKDNNGHLQAAFAWCKRYGIGSTNTLADAISDLIAHGFVYRTRSHGANGVWAKYAVTWLPIKKPDGLFIAGFKMYAWRDWDTTSQKSSSQNLRRDCRKNRELSPENIAETATNLVSETATYESCCHGVRREEAGNPSGDTSAHMSGGWIHDYLIRLAEHGLGADCPVTTFSDNTEGRADCEFENRRSLSSTGSK